MTSQFVTIKGNDLDYFREIVQRGISGQYGTVSELRITVTDRGMALGTNGYESENIGTVDTATDGEKATETVAFTTIPQAPGMKKKHRIAALERQVGELQQFAERARPYIP